MNKIFSLLILLLILASCASKKEILYFQDADKLNLLNNAQVFEPTIEINDVLHIGVSSMDELVIAPFIKPAETAVSGNQNPLLRGYLVNAEGIINFPVLGGIKVVGKTRGEVESNLKDQLSEFVKDVVVDVRIMNFKVTVLGAVNNPGVFTIQDERVTIPQAIGLAGDLSENADRNNVMIIREFEGKQQVTKVDFTRTDLFQSPFYFLKQNDIVYIEPSLKGVKRSGFIPDIPALLSLFTVVLSAVILITR